MTHPDEATRAELIQAIRAADGASLESLLEREPELASARDEHGNSALLLSVYHGRPAMTAALLSRAATVSIFEACAAGLLPEVEKMLAADPEVVRQRSHDGWTPLHLAAFFGHVGIVKRLVSAGSDLLATSHNQEQNLAINAAAARGRNDVVRLLVEQGCPVDARGSTGGHTALHLAAHAGNTELVRYLLNAGADPHLKTESGETPLTLALAKRHYELAGLLG